MGRRSSGTLPRPSAGLRVALRLSKGDGGDVIEKYPLEMPCRQLVEVITDYGEDGPRVGWG